MTARGYLRGHPIEYDGERWIYSDTGDPTSWEERTLQAEERPCGHCGQHRTPEGHDPCLGTLPGVANACCGHGRPSESYVQFTNGMVLRGS